MIQPHSQQAPWDTKEAFRLRVVLATDRPHLGDALRVFLSEHGIDVVAVARMPGGHRLASKMHPDVVLIDWQLTGAGASCVVADLKARRQTGPRHRDVHQHRAALANMAEADGHVTVATPGGAARSPASGWCRRLTRQGAAGRARLLPAPRRSLVRRDARLCEIPD